MRYEKQRRAMKLAHSIKADYKKFSEALKAAWAQIKNEEAIAKVEDKVEDMATTFIKELDRLKKDDVANIYEIRRAMGSPAGFDEMAHKLEEDGKVYLMWHSDPYHLSEEDRNDSMRDTRGLLAMVRMR